MKVSWSRQCHLSVDADLVLRLLRPCLKMLWTQRIQRAAMCTCLPVESAGCFLFTRAENTTSYAAPLGESRVSMMDLKLIDQNLSVSWSYAYRYGPTYHVLSACNQSVASLRHSLQFPSFFSNKFHVRTRNADARCMRPSSSKSAPVPTAFTPLVSRLRLVHRLAEFSRPIGVQAITTVSKFRRIVTSYLLGRTQCDDGVSLPDIRFERLHTITIASHIFRFGPRQM